MAVRRLVGARTRVEWTDTFDDLPEAESPLLAATILRVWALDYLARPNGELGRDGPVCPYVKPAIAHHALRSVFISGDTELSVERMCAVVDDAVDLFLALTRPEGAGAQQQALLVVFPDLTDFTRVDAVHAARKGKCVAAGMMLGQFYPGCGQPGLWSKDFRPLDAPLPMLVVRNMMPSDYPFLVGNSEWLFAYMSRFGRALPVKLRRSIAEHLHSAVADNADAITEHRVHSIEDFAGPRPESAGGVGTVARMRRSGDA